MTPSVPNASVAQLRAAIAALRSELAVATSGEAREPLRARLEAVYPDVARELTPQLAFNLKNAVVDGLGSDALVRRVDGLLGEVDAELARRERTLAYHRSLPRTIGSILLWLVAVVLALIGGIAAVFGVIASRTSRDAGEFTRQALSAGGFYVLLAAAFASFGAALWLRGDPRARPLNSRWLSLLGVIAIVASVVSAFATTRGEPLPVLSDAQRYEVLSVASVLPPGTTGWVAKRDSQAGVEAVSFSRDVGTRDTAENNETLRAHIVASSLSTNLLPPGEVMQAAIDGGRQSVSDDRVKELSFVTASPAGRKDCQRWDGVGRDTGVAQFPGRPFLLTVHGIGCVSASHIAIVEWSHRYLEGATPVVSESEAEPYLASFAFKAAEALPAAAPLPTTGNRLFIDRFTDPKSGWSLFDNEFGVTSYLKDGGYGMQIRRPESHLSVGSRFAPRPRNVLVESEIVISQSEPSVSYGPICRVDESFRSYYWFGVRGAGAYSLLRIGAENSVVLATSVGPRRAIAAPATLRIALYCVTGAKGAVTLVGAVNGTPLLRAEDRDGALDREGIVGFYLGSSAATSQIRMNAFTVSDAAR